MTSVSAMMMAKAMNEGGMDRRRQWKIHIGHWGCNKRRESKLCRMPVLRTNQKIISFKELGKEEI